MIAGTDPGTSVVNKAGVIGRQGLAGVAAVVLTVAQQPSPPWTDNPNQPGAHPVKKPWTLSLRLLARRSCLADPLLEQVRTA